MVRMGLIDLPSGISRGIIFFFSIAAEDLNRLSDAFANVAGLLYLQRIATSRALDEERAHPKKIITEPDFTTPFQRVKNDGFQKFAAALRGGTQVPLFES